MLSEHTSVRIAGDGLRVMASIPKPDGPTKLTFVVESGGERGLVSAVLTVGEAAHLIAVLTQSLASAATKYVRRKGVTERATVTIDGEGGDE